MQLRFGLQLIVNDVPLQFFMIILPTLTSRNDEYVTSMIIEHMMLFDSPSNLDAETCNLKSIASSA